MVLPDKVSLTQVSPTMVLVSGWASEPFEMTEASARKSLERVRSRRATYAPGEYEKHLAVYVEAFRLMGWEIPEDKNAPVPPSTPPAPQAAPVDPTPPQTALVAQPGTQAASNLQSPEPQAEPPIQTIIWPVTAEAPVAPTAEKTWLEKMIEEEQAKS